MQALNQADTTNHNDGVSVAGPAGAGASPHPTSFVHPPIRPGSGGVCPFGHSAASANHQRGMDLPSIDEASIANTDPTSDRDTLPERDVNYSPLQERDRDSMSSRGDFMNNHGSSQPGISSSAAPSPQIEARVIDINSRSQLSSPTSPNTNSNGYEEVSSKSPPPMTSQLEKSPSLSEGAPSAGTSTYTGRCPALAAAAAAGAISIPVNGTLGAAAAAAPVTAAAPEPPAPVDVSTYRSPKNTLLKIIKAGLAKGKMTWWRILIMGFMAGVYIGVGGLLSLFAAGGSPGLKTGGYVSIQKFLGGALFPIGLMLVVVAGGELFTGNVMYVGASLISRKSTWKEAAKNCVLSYLGNFIGSLAAAYFLGYLPEMLHQAPYYSYLQDVTVLKCTNGWGVNLLRGVGCNMLVCIALYFAMSADDLSGKILALWWPVMAFVTLGYEHCVANMFIIPLGLMEGANTTVGNFISRNLIPVTIGNIIGGFLLVAVVQFVVFSDFFGERLAGMRLRHADTSKKRLHFWNHFHLGHFGHKNHHNNHH